MTAPGQTARAITAADAIPASSLHAIHRLVQARAGDSIPLHVGDPHLRMPPAAEEAFVRALRDGHTRYTDAPGLPELRAALAARLAVNGAPSPDLLFVTPGSCQAIVAVLQSVATAGGIVLLPRVHWPVHLQQVLLAGLTPRFVPMTDDDGAVLDVLEESYDPYVCAIIVNSPANPSGAVASRTLLAGVHAWAARHGVWLISDEAYEDFVYEGYPPATAAFDQQLPPAERVVFSVHTFSKGYSMTGCRLGYVAAPSAAAAERLMRVQEATLVAPSTPVQHAALGALTDTAFLTAHHRYVRDTRDAVLAALQPDGLVWMAPPGGWYLMVDLSAHTSDSDVLCRDLLERTGVALAPGLDFFPPGDSTGAGLARLTLCHEREQTLEGIRRLRAYLGSPP